MKQEQVEMLLENIDSKFNIVIESHQSLSHDIAGLRTDLNEKFDFLNFKIDTVNDHLTKKINTVEEKLTDRIDSVEEKLTNRIDNVKQSLSEKIDAVASDLKAHRNDTEAHQIYQVKER